MDYVQINASPFLRIAADYDYRSIIACAALEEIARDDYEFKRLQEKVTYVQCEDGVHREPISRNWAGHGGVSALSMAIDLGLIIGLAYNGGTPYYIRIETAFGKPLAILNVPAWSEVSTRRNRIDLVPGGFIRAVQLMREYHALIDSPTGKLDLNNVYPDFDLDLFVRDDGERLKRSDFVRSLLGYLETRNISPEKGRINDLMKLCHILLNITVNFETVEGDKALAIEVRVDGIPTMFKFPRGILAHNVREHHVLAELEHARAALANKPLF